MVTKSLIIAFVLVLPIAVGAQIDVDYAVFYYDSSQVYWEVYYTIPRHQMTYTTTSTGEFSCLGLLRLKLVKDGVAWKELAWKIQDVLPDTVRMQRTTKLLDRVQVLAPPGAYSVTLSLQDLHHSLYQDSVSFSVSISGFPSEKLGLSDIELASSIERNPRDKKNPFYKNTLLVIPNPSRVFSDVLHFYVETYHLLKNIPGETYKIHYSVLDTNGKPRKEITPSSLVRRKQVDSRVEIGTVSLASLPMGSYLFHFAIADSADKELVVKNAKFYMYTVTQIPQNELNLSSLVHQSEFGSMNESDLDQDFSWASYLSTFEEREIYHALKDVESKRQFLYSFWQKRDTNPATTTNEFRQEYLRRIQYANEKYSAFKKEGWKTDRGRVYLLYGEPSYVDRHPSTEGYKPFEIWQYDEVQGGVIFVFADLSGFRDYILIHSTALGEVQYPNYMERIKRGF
ncbi:MAG: GWxTD domain-containing protein [candidate division KSB1 bacterium]|nr:GWxTD domain-containing protein [candidate division KSB1 bacterium]